MYSDVAIEIDNVSKCFHIYEKPHDRLRQMLSFGDKRYFKEFWALNSVSFKIKRGTTVGIVGRNGSGKSTLLQMICGTLSPSSGSIITSGRIAALLELGSGFNPEFTGRENVYMNSAVLGLTRKETDERYNEITDFADIGSFIDQPVKTYSSGMLVRLAFSVAINVDPEILIIDEALSVGDELFQRKCFARIEAIKKKGATILFVSHSGSAVIELCDHAVLLDSGEVLASGLPKAIVGEYQKLLYAPKDKRLEIRNKILGALDIGAEQNNLVTPVSKILGPEVIESDGEFFDPHLKPISTIEFESHGAYIEDPRITSLSGHQVNSLVRGKKYIYSFNVRFDNSATNVRFGMVIRTTSGLSLGGSHSSTGSNSIPYVSSGSVLSISFIFDCCCNPGTYFMNAGVFGVVGTGQDETVLHRLVDAIVFRVAPIENNLATEFIDFGCIPGIKFL